MQLSENALTTLETTREYLDIPQTDTTPDRILRLLINSASEFIQAYVRRSFKKGTYTGQLYDGPNGQRLYLKNAPIASVASLSFNGILQEAGSYVLYGDNGYVFYSNGNWPIGNQNIAVTYTGGYVLPKDATTENPRTLPYNIELATLMLISGAYNKKGAEGTTNSNSGSMSVNYANILNDDIKSLLKPYRYYNV